MVRNFLLQKALLIQPQAMIAACMIGSVHVVLIFHFRDYIANLFTHDAEVVALIRRVLPICAAFQLFDALATNCNGLLRGLGCQAFGAWTSIFCYYVIAIPISFSTAFILKWELEGLWSGIAIALGLISAFEGWFLWTIDWESAVEDAEERNIEA